MSVMEHENALLQRSSQIQMEKAMLKGAPQMFAEIVEHAAGMFRSGLAASFCLNVARGRNVARLSEA
jgi:hypothetical protein